MQMFVFSIQAIIKSFHNSYSILSWKVGKAALFFPVVPDTFCTILLAFKQCNYWAIPAERTIFDIYKMGPEYNLLLLSPLPVSHFILTHHHAFREACNLPQIYSASGKQPQIYNVLLLFSTMRP